MEDANASIFDLSYRCEVLFSQTTSEPRLATARSRLEELHQRFSAWVSYLGALAPGHASLDHRLRFSTEVRSMVVELLLLLRRNLLTGKPGIFAGPPSLSPPLLTGPSSDRWCSSRRRDCGPHGTSSGLAGGRGPPLSGRCRHPQVVDGEPIVPDPGLLRQARRRRLLFQPGGRNREMEVS